VRFREGSWQEARTYGEIRNNQSMNQLIAPWKYTYDILMLSTFLFAHILFLSAFIVL
jgi:hypothetical protein